MTKVKINVNGLPTRVSVVVNNSLSLSLSLSHAGAVHCLIMGMKAATGPIVHKSSLAVNYVSLPFWGLYFAVISDLFAVWSRSCQDLLLFQ